MKDFEEKKNYYDILGVPKYASLDQIKNAYRKLVKLYHPDLFPNDEEKAERFRLIKEAYEVLSKTETREAYDRFGISRPVDGREFFESTFVSSEAGQSGEDIEQAIYITPNQKGNESKIPIERMEVCPLCQGRGSLSPDNTWQICPDCKGKGKSKKSKANLLSEKITYELCLNCGGRGKIPSIPCPRCEGKGRIKKRDIITVKIPERLQEGQRIVLKGLGNEAIEGGRGDLIIIFHLKRYTKNI